MKPRLKLRGDPNQQTIPEADLRRALTMGRWDCRGHTADGAPKRPAPSMDELREAWERLGPEILDHFQRRQPGRRPWGYWAFDQPEAFRWPLHLYGCIETRDRYCVADCDQYEWLHARGLITDQERRTLEPVPQ